MWFIYQNALIYQEKIFINAHTYRNKQTIQMMDLQKKHQKRQKKCIKDNLNLEDNLNEKIYVINCIQM